MGDPLADAEAGLGVAGDTARAAEAPADDLVVTVLNTVKIQPLRWLVEYLLPLGKLVMIAGDGGQGKSTLSLAVAADLSTGRPAFGWEYEAPGPCDVLLVSCEDDTADTVVPRLLAHGADLARVAHANTIRKPDGKLADFSLAHVEVLKRHLTQHPATKLIIVDPVASFVGKAKIDDHKASELRSLLDPLAALAAETQVTILLLAHLNKATGSKAAYRVAGSAAYVQAVRLAFTLEPDPEDPARRLLLPTKGNLPGGRTGMAFGVELLPADEREALLAAYAGHLAEADRIRLGDQLTRMRFLENVEATADEVMSMTRRGDGGNKIERCGAWLLDFLKEHAYPSKVILEAAAKAGFTKDNCYKAKQRHKDQIAARPDGLCGGWIWGLGDPRGWAVRREPPPASDPAPNSHNSPNSELMTHKSPNSRVGCPGPELGAETPELGELGDLWEGRETPNSGPAGEGYSGSGAGADREVYEE